MAVGADRDGIEGLARAERAGLPTFVHRVKDFTDRAAWDRALTASVAEHRPDLVISAGFMKLVGTAFLAEFGGRFVNTHPALSPAFPGMHGAAEALAYGVKVTGCTIFFVDDGVDTGPIVAQAAVAGRGRRHLRFAARADQGRRARAAGRHRRRDGAPGLHHRGQEGPPWLTQTPAIPITRALVSVYDKSGLEELVRGLHEAGVALVSTGGSAALIEGLGIPVTKVEELTGFPECLDGRVKTLHPKVHAGILADRRLESHVQQLEELGIEPFDLVVSNLYPFRQTVLSGASPDECVEQIDIGGPSMVRAAAKNHPSVAIVTSPARYADVLAAVAAGGFTLAERQRLAAEAFQHTATYDVAVASWMSNVLTDTSEGTGFPSWTGATWDKAAVLRYGENPHQPAALYRHWRGGLASAEQLHGKEMSYNNYVDTDAARRAAYDFTEPAVAIIKHANPCGIAVGADVAEAHRRAHECDPTSAFGGVIAVNRPVSVAMAEQVAEIFTEVIVAPAYDDGAVEVLQCARRTSGSWSARPTSTPTPWSSAGSAAAC